GAEAGAAQHRDARVALEKGAQHEGGGAGRSLLVQRVSFQDSFSFERHTAVHLKVIDGPPHGQVEEAVFRAGALVRAVPAGVVPAVLLSLGPRPSRRSLRASSEHT